MRETDSEAEVALPVVQEAPPKPAAKQTVARGRNASQSKKPAQAREAISGAEEEDGEGLSEETRPAPSAVSVSQDQFDKVLNQM